MWKKPDLIIGDPPQTLRWHLFRWRGLQIALHKWMRSDSDRALHDHSADNVSIILNRGYWEVVGDIPPGVQNWKWRSTFVPYFRKAETPHRVQLVGEEPVWTIWIRFAPRREWGFWCPKGWRRWQDYCDRRDQGKVGVGCD